MFLIRVFFRVVSLMTLLVLVIFGATLYQIYSFGQKDMASPTAVAVVMGAAEFDGSPSLVLRARLDHVILLYRAGLIKSVVTTGGRQRGDLYTEAGVAKQYLSDRGIPSVSIISDPVGDDTYNSMLSVKVVLRTLGVSRAIFVSDGFHEYRINQIAGQLGIIDLSSPTRTSPIAGVTEFEYYLRETVAVLGAKLVGYKFLSLLRHGT